VKIIAVVGSGSGCGKTTVVCRILRAIPGLGAVKISPREGPSRVEWGRGEPGKDTDLYVESGASCVARIVGPRDGVVRTWNLIKKSAFEALPGVVVEGSRSVDLPGERFVIFVDGSDSNEVRRNRKRFLASISDAILYRSPHKNDEIFTQYQFSSHISSADPEQESCFRPRSSPSDHDLVEKICRFLAIRRNG
jgi:molybdopterin-guanine dinucleotide biosynthesis protein